MSTNQTLLLPRWLLSMKPGEGVLTDQAVLLEGERIAAVGSAETLSLQHPGAQRVNLPEHVLLPGLINAHTHSAMSLLRGVADDLGLMDWLNKHIWPLEKRWVSHAWTRLGSLFSAAEALRGGVTTLNDMYFFPKAMAEAALEAGIRCAVSINVIDFPTGYASGPDDYIAKGVEAYREFKGEPLLQFTSSPHAPYTVSDASFVKLRELAEREAMQMHCHIHETLDEVNGSLKEHGVRPLERLDRLGLLNERMIAVHMVHLTDGEIELLARRGVHIAHNASSNLKLASGHLPRRRPRRGRRQRGAGNRRRRQQQPPGHVRGDPARPRCWPRAAAGCPPWCRRAARWRWPPSTPPRRWVARPIWAPSRSASWPT
jgi:5-methylthioadenosine/S-adenosylhomocysteine deaminase